MVLHAPCEAPCIDRTTLRIRSGLSLGALGAVIGIAPASVPVAAALALALAADALGRALTRASSPLQALAGVIVRGADLPPEPTGSEGRRVAAALEGGTVFLGACLLLAGAGPAVPVLGVVVVCTALDGLFGVCLGCVLAGRVQGALQIARGVSD